MSDRRDGPDDRRDYGDGPTPGAQRQLDEHLRLIRLGLGACGALFFLLVVFVAIGGTKIGNVAQDARNAVDTAEAERAARTDSVASIIDFGCQTDNGQDQTLADLIEVSLKGGTFGSNIDPAQLSPEALAVVKAIAEVQTLALQAPPTQQQIVFQRKLKALRDLTSCPDLVDTFRNAQTLPPPPVHPDPVTTMPAPTTPDRILGQ